MIHRTGKIPLVLRRAMPLLAAALLWTLSSCSGPDRGRTINPVPAGGVLVKGAGATFPSLLYQHWFAAYQSSHPQTIIAYDSVGSGEGVRRFVGKNVKEEEKVDFGASDAAMKDEEMAQVPQGVLLLPATAGGVVLAYNLPDLVGDLRLSRQAYGGIFLGEIKNWNDPLIVKTNPGTKLSKLTIAIVVRQESSGTTYAFTKHLDAINGKWHSQHRPGTLVDWPGNAMRAIGNERVAALIKQSVGSIGYVGYEFARKLGLRMALLENKEGYFVKPTDQSCTAALARAELPENLRLFVPDPPGPDSYPIVTFSWILLSKNYADGSKAKAIRDLFHWCLTDGQIYAADLGYIRLPPNVSERAVAGLTNMVRGE